MSAPDTYVVLTDGATDFTFSAMEVPEKITVGGSQRLSTHTLVGGKRVVDSMGRSDRDLEWSGLFLGQTATSRAQYLDGLRVAGRQLTLTWAQYSYAVIVADFSADYERFYQIPYRITCNVVQDNTTPVTTIAPAPIDDQINSDMLDGLGFSGQIGDSTLSAFMSNLSTAVNAVQSFVNAAASMVNSVLSPLGLVQGRISAMIGPLDLTLGTSLGFGGIVAGASASASVAALNVQISATTQMTNLLSLRGLCGRMGNNLLAINASDVTLATAGGNLFHIATQEYGDPMAWTGIAKANGLIDPFIQGSVTLTIPNRADALDGVLGS